MFIVAETTGSVNILFLATEVDIIKTLEFLVDYIFGHILLYKLWYKDATYIATHERKICNMEIARVTFVINGCMKFTVFLNRQSKSR